VTLDDLECTANEKIRELLNSDGRDQLMITDQVARKERISWPEYCDSTKRVIRENNKKSTKDRFGQPFGQFWTG